MSPEWPGPALHEAVGHLGFLVGRWQGLGVVGYPTMSSTAFEQEVEFTHDGRAFLSYRARSWLLDEAGDRTAPSQVEQGYWRPGAEPRSVEVLLTQATGHVEVYVGEVAFHKVELVTDLVARTTTAPAVGGLRRLYGLVPGDGDEQDLAYAIDLAAVEQPLQAHASATLRRVVGAPEGESSLTAGEGEPGRGRSSMSDLQQWL